jgi:hypothetical protein
MKTKFTIYFFLIVLQLASQAPDWSWVRENKGSADSRTTRVAADASGNIFVTGKFEGSSATFGATTVNNSGGAGTSEFYVAKYDPLGALLWVHTAPGNDDDEGLSLSTDGSGNVYVTGYFESPTLVFGGTTLTNNSNPGIADLFVVKYTASGTVSWAHNYGGTQEESGTAVFADASGNTFVTGMFYSLSVMFGGYGVVNSGVSDAFLVKFNPSGVALWAKQIGGGMTDNGLAVTADASGNVFVAGEFNSGTISSFSPGIVNAGGFDIFYGKYSGTGNFIFGGRLGGANSERANSLVTDAAGNFYMSGFYESSSLNFGSISLTSGSLRDMFVAKFNNSGTVQWAKKAAGNPSSGPENLAIDNTGLYLAGTFNLASISFGTNSISNSGGTDAFLVKYDVSNGNELWAKKFGGSGFEQGLGVAASPGNVYLTGLYSGSVTAGPIQITSAGNSDGFLAKLCVLPSTPVASSPGASVCPSAVATLSVSVTGGNVSWYSASSGGSPLASGANTFTTNTAATYYAEAVSNSGCVNPQRTPVTSAFYPAINPVATLSGSVLTASPASAGYKWYNCTQATTIQGATSSTFGISVTGNYAVIVTLNGCADTSACMFYSVTPSGTITPPPPPPPPPPPDPTVVVTWLEEQDAAKEFVVYPNPNNGSFTIKCAEPSQFILYDFTGRIVFTFSVTGKGEEIQAPDITAGIYILGSSRHRKKMVVTK